LNKLNNSNIIYIKLIFATIFFGSTPVAGKILTLHLPLFTSIFLRFFSASLFLVLIVFKAYGKLPQVNFRGFLLILSITITGILGFNYFLFSGLHIITASRASIIIALNPSLISLFSALLFKEKFTKLKFMGIILSFIGAIIVISKGNLGMIFHGNIGKGELLILGCVVSWASFALIGKIAMKDFPPIVIITHACLIGTFIIAIPAVLEGELQNFLQYNYNIWISVFVMGFLGSVLAFIWYYEGIEKIGPSRTAVFNNLSPAFTALLAVFILHEKITLPFVLGAILILIGIYMTNNQGKKGKIAIEGKY